MNDDKWVIVGACGMGWSVSGRSLGLAPRFAPGQRPEGRARPVVPRFAALAAMTKAERDAALRGPDRDAWIEAAAQYGIADGQALFAEALLARGEAVLALRWFRAAAAGGHAAARNMVGRCLEKGWGAAPDPEGAAAQYRLAAEAGDAWGAFNLGMALLYGIGVGRDRPAAFAAFERAAAAGSAKAPNMLGRFFEEGWDRPRDLRRAAAHYRAGAEAGDFRAGFNLGTVLLGAGRRNEALPLLRAAWGAGTADFLREAGAALRASGDPELAAIAAG